MRLPIHALQPILIKALGQEEDAWYRSTVVDFQVHKELVVSLPTAKDRLGWEPPVVPDGGSVDDADDDMTDSQFTRGTELEVQISFPDGLRRFSSTVRKIDLSFGGSLYVDWPTEATRIQRREHVRVEVRLPAKVRYSEVAGVLRDMEGDTIDLSAGGTRLLLAEPIPDEMAIELRVQAEPLAEEPLQGRVVRSGEVSRDKIRRGLAWWVAVEFVALDPRSLKAMTRYVVELQRQQLRRNE